MTRASKSRFAPGYDLFKAIVAVILLLLLFALIWLERQQPAAPLATPTLASVATPEIQPSSTLLPPTNTPTLQPTETPKPTPSPKTPDNTPVAPPIVDTPPPTPTQVPVPTATTPALTFDPNGCPSASSRIQVGNQLRVLVRLNFRSRPGLNSPILLTNMPGTTLQVIGGPACLRLSNPDGPDKAYLWWNVRKENGMEGWSAEGSLNGGYYFLEPVN